MHEGVKCSMPQGGEVSREGIQRWYAVFMLEKVEQKCGRSEKWRWKRLGRSGTKVRFRSTCAHFREAAPEVEQAET